MVHLKLINVFVESKLCQLHYRTLKVRFYVIKYIFCIELTINMNCRFDSFELDSYSVFFGKVMYIFHFQCPVV